jgi:iron complex outermembrane receptor protein
MVTRIAASTAFLSIAAVSLAHAQGVASDKLIDSITVTGERQRIELDVPAPTASKTADALRAQNLVNPEDALRYVPNVTIRKRYIGDRNALIGGRSFSTLQAPRGLVLMDGYLLSNFLGRFDAPRWNMISPEEIDRVDVLYGPFSALYPGNSIGTTVQVRTRRPEQRQLSVRTTAFGENFDQYGDSEDHSGYQAWRSSATPSTTARGSRWPRIVRIRRAIRCSTSRCHRVRPGNSPRCRPTAWRRL